MGPVTHAQVDGLVDAITIGVGFFVVLTKLGIRRGKGKPLSLSACGVDLLHGTVVTPFVLMVASVFSVTAYEYLRSTSAVMTAIAGGIGLLFVLFELVKID
jgi:hypothetical protein